MPIPPVISVIPSKYFNKEHDNLDFLIKEGIYRSEYPTFTRGPRHGIKRILNRWEQSRVNLETIHSTVTYPYLKSNKSKLPPHDDRITPDFRVIASTPNPIQVTDSHGNVLAYRFRVDSQYIQTLTNTAALLPTSSSSKKPTIRGAFDHRHYALWADYSQTIFQTSEYKKDLPHSLDFINANQQLFKQLSDTLRLLSPIMYQKFHNPVAYLPDSLKYMCGAWPGLAVNKNLNQDSKSATHQDVKDYYAGYNCVLPFGDFWTGGELVLWQLKLRFDLQPGDVLFFFGSLIAHNCTPITSGVRNSIDLFYHKSVFDWKKRQDLRRNKGGPRAKKSVKEPKKKSLKRKRD